jgi:hypothetical protein
VRRLEEMSQLQGDLIKGRIESFTGERWWEREKDLAVSADNDNAFVALCGHAKRF